MLSREGSMSSLLMALLIAAPIGAGAETADTVTIDSGKVQGVETDGIVSFKGIPFAMPPLGDLRWRVPQPVTPWGQTLKANTLSADCIQPQEASTGAGAAENVSEDCLYLNVWVPANAEDKQLPVFFWIYGGGLTKGGATVYPGEGLAAQGVIVVTSNYRLGRLGFFAHPGVAAEAPDDVYGNYGYMDQLAALKWVQRNIAAFGGDPTKVTIAGESAGGGSVIAHLISPLSKGLFRAAIVESPGLMTARAYPGPVKPLEVAEGSSIEYAKTLGLTGDDASVLRQLRALPAKTFSEGVLSYAMAGFGGTQIPGLSSSMIDGRMILESAETALRNKRQTMVPVIAGANDADLGVTPGLTKNALFARFGVLANEARRVYDPDGDVDVRALLQDIPADCGMVEPSRYLAEAMTEAGQKAYFYRFGYVAEVMREKVPGAIHAAEVAYAFNVISHLLGDKATPADLKTAEMVSNYWVNFVKTGDPNGDGLPDWKPYDTKSGDVLNITNDGIAYGTDPIKVRLDLCQQAYLQ
ncbi:carboxylesterase/lipase family protein [Ensifer sp. NPDC090286]|uniref:carboxylesterase/lipase family protein n=1 Tax=Ensifer sp. NPDC090286 TaxID=3363991 RepID=UPI00383A2BB4